MAAVECEFRVAGTCHAETVAVYWKGERGAEVWYHDVHRAGRVRQGTFAGHTWVFRDKATGEQVASFVASEEREQVVMVSGAAFAAAAPARALDPSALLAFGEWSGDGVRYVRGNSGDNYWRELDDVGHESMVLEQLECHYATAWLWWLSMGWVAFNCLDANQQAAVGSLVFIASAQQHQLPSVPWPAQLLALCRLLHLPPSTVCILAVLLGGAVVASTVPIMSGHLLLRDLQSGRLLKITDRVVLMKGDQANGGSWRELAHGSWARPPGELQLTRSHRLWHGGYIAAVAVLLTRIAYRL
ncbi:hypothetical protein T492DRAFT_1059160 [Pavlovales sp. CCMP2436]|nr:hypothetical protein T492DRAFT_1059160 [Pavlovales sp. CCMP2436]